MINRYFTIIPILTYGFLLVIGFTDKVNEKKMECEDVIFELCPDYTFQLEEWRITEVDGSFFIEHLYEEKITYELYWDAGGPDLNDVVGLGDDHIIIVYLSGSVGTSSIINIYRGLIFDIWEMAFIGDFPYKYENQNDRDHTLTQPEWTLKDGVLHIKDVNEGIDFELEL